MDKKRKQALKNAFHAPAPTGKAAFLKKYRRLELNRWDFLLIQAGYIRRWIWAVSVLLFGSALWLSLGQDSEKVWAAAALAPFLALLIVVENGKSRFYGMEELELSCRLPLRTVALARMALLGLFHLLLLGTLITVMAAWWAVGLLRAGLYLLTPYLLTAALGMELTRRCRGQEGLLACCGAAVLVSGAGMLLAYQRLALYQQSAMPLWGTALAAAAIAAAVELALNGKIRGTYNGLDRTESDKKV